MYRKRNPHHLGVACSALLTFVNMLYAQAAQSPTRVDVTSSATSSPADVYTPEQLRAMISDLMSKAAITGAASKTLVQYPGHYTMLAYRNRSGGAEQHAKFADIFVILEGSAILQTGGTILGQTVSAPGEIRGEALEGFSERPLHVGDIVHIPAGTPHLMKLEKKATISYFVVKIEESP